MVRESETQIYKNRLAQAKALEMAGINPYPAEPPPRTHKNAELTTRFSELKGNEVSVVGRMISKRIHGAIAFADLEDESGKIQTVWFKDKLGDRYLLIRNNFDVGDFVGITGVLDKTKAGEISVLAEQILMLVKALRPAPKKLANPELQQRRRYLHTLVDREARERFRVRSQIVQMMREYFTNKLGCLEVETPILDTTYGGASARPFETRHWALGEKKLYLRISNELYLKRLTVGGYYEGVFEFSRDFRNEGMDRTHNPEFTQLELYIPFWDYHMMMDMVEDSMAGIVKEIHGKLQVPFGKHTIDYTPPWRRLTIYDGLRQKLKIEPTKTTLDDFKALAKKHGVEGHTKDELMLKLFEEIWEKELIQPTFVLDYPTETSSLAKRHRADPNLTERFELFVGGIETMNCFTELNDPRDQRERFEIEKRKRERGDREAMPFDEEFIRAQEYGMPPQAGIGISIDRWAMLLTNTEHIRQIIYFPTLRQKTKD